MNQMDKETYIRILKKKLEGLPEEDIQDAVAYVTEYFDEAGVGNEQSVIEELGPPSKFAATIKADSATKIVKGQKRSERPRTSLRKGMTIFLGICAMPVALPVLFALIMLMFAFLMIIFAFGLVGICGVAALALGGIPMMIKGFFSFGAPGMAMVSLGSGLLSIGIGILLCIASYKLITYLVPLFTRGITRLYERIRGQRSYEKE